MNDNQLIKYCKQGKPKYQRALLEKYSARLMGVARRYTYDGSEAKDILQDAWIKIFKALMNENYKEQGQLFGWMSRIVINLALKSKAKSEARVLKMERVKKLQQGHDDSCVVDSMTVDSILKIIDGLSPPSNQVFKLFIVDGFKHKEIADLLGIAESTSRVHLTNARAKIKSYFPNFQELINTK